MKAKLCLYLAVISLAVSLSVRAGLPVTVALDNADFPAYAPQPTHNWAPINGGFGYNVWTPLADTGGGGTYMEGVGVNGRQVEGNFSFALYAGGGSYDISRALTGPIAAGEFDIITRFDIAGAGPNLVNLRAGNNLASFSAGELLSFGIVNGNQLSYTDGTGFHVLPSGESRGSVWSWNIDFNAAAGTYSGSVTNLGGGFAAFFNGNLESSGTSVDSFAVINSSTGNNENVIFDVPTFSVVPEPATLSLMGLGFLALLRPRRRS
jgi:PEP-CTERM motif